ADDSEQMLEELEQRLLGPVQVLEEQDCRPVADELVEERNPRVLEAVARDERMGVAGHVESEREGEDLAPAEPLERGLRRVALEQAEMLPQDLAERPVRDLSVRQAAARALKRLGLLVGEPLPQLSDEPRLADPRVADDRHE